MLLFFYFSPLDIISCYPPWKMTVYPFVLYCSPYHGSIPIIMILDRSIFSVYILWLDKVICIWFTYSGGSDSEGSACNARRPRFNPWVGKIHWRRKWLPTPVFLPGESHGQRDLAGYIVHGVAKSQTGHSWATDTFTFVYSLKLTFPVTLFPLGLITMMYSPV